MREKEQTVSSGLKKTQSLLSVSKLTQLTRLWFPLGWTTVTSVHRFHLAPPSSPHSPPAPACYFSLFNLPHPLYPCFSCPFSSPLAVENGGSMFVWFLNRRGQSGALC